MAEFIREHIKNRNGVLNENRCDYFKGKLVLPTTTGGSRARLHTRTHTHTSDTCKLRDEAECCISIRTTRPSRTITDYHCGHHPSAPARHGSNTGDRLTRIRLYSHAPSFASPPPHLSPPLRQATV